MDKIVHGDGKNKSISFKLMCNATYYKTITNTPCFPLSHWHKMKPVLAQHHASFWNRWIRGNDRCTTSSVRIVNDPTLKYMGKIEQCLVTTKNSKVRMGSFLGMHSFPIVACYLILEHVKIHGLWLMDIYMYGKRVELTNNISNGKWDTEIHIDWMARTDIYISITFSISNLYLHDITPVSWIDGLYLSIEKSWYW